MRLVIVRHGKAKPGSNSGMDFDRKLREQGKRQAAYLAEQFENRLPPVDAVVTSRAVRAKTTAEIIASGLGIDVCFDDRLLVDEPVSPVLDLIKEQQDAACLVLVGHNPQCEYLAAVLTGRPMSYTTRVRTGEAVVLEINPDEPLESGEELDRMRLTEKD